MVETPQMNLVINAGSFVKATAEQNYNRRLPYTCEKLDVRWVQLRLGPRLVVIRDKRCRCNREWQPVDEPWLASAGWSGSLVTTATGAVIPYALHPSKRPAPF